jgi:hypothetical protein
MYVRDNLMSTPIANRPLVLTYSISGRRPRGAITVEPERISPDSMSSDTSDVIIPRPIPIRRARSARDTG